MSLEINLEEQIKQLKKRVKKLEDQNKPTKFNQPYYLNMPKADISCLHNGCNHERNPVCNLYCPHCSPIC